MITKLWLVAPVAAVSATEQAQIDQKPFPGFQASPPGGPGGPDPTLDEGLFHVLYGLSLSLSSIGDLLHSPCGGAHGGDAQRATEQLQVGSESPTVLPS